MVDLRVLQEKSAARVADTLVGVMVEPHVKDVEVRTVLLDGTPACWLAPVAALGPRNAETADGHPVCASDVKGVPRPIGVYFRAAPVGVGPLEGIPAIGVDGTGEFVGTVLDGEGRGGRAVRRYPTKVFAGAENRVASRGGGGKGYP